MLERRGLLKGLVTLPLIGGGVTLIGKAAARVPLMDVAAAPILDDPCQRARYAWAAFSAAMRDVAAGSDGWQVMGGEQLRSVGYMPVREPWLNANTVRLELLGRGTGLVADRLTHIDLGCGS